jgi:hypothetical protein
MSFFKEEKRTQYSPLMTREEQVRDDDDAKDDGRHRTRQSIASPIQSKSRQRDDSREQNEMMATLTMTDTSFVHSLVRSLV